MSFIESVFLGRGGLGDILRVNCSPEDRKQALDAFFSDELAIPGRMPFIVCDPIRLSEPFVRVNVYLNPSLPQQERDVLVAYLSVLGFLNIEPVIDPEGNWTQIRAKLNIFDTDEVQPGLCGEIQPDARVRGALRLVVDNDAPKSGVESLKYMIVGQLRDCYNDVKRQGFISPENQILLQEALVQAAKQVLPVTEDQSGTDHSLWVEFISGYGNPRYVFHDGLNPAFSVRLDLTKKGFPFDKAVEFVELLYSIGMTPLSDEGSGLSILAVKERYKGDAEFGLVQYDGYWRADKGRPPLLLTGRWRFFDDQGDLRPFNEVLKSGGITSYECLFEPGNELSQEGEGGPTILTHEERHYPYIYPQKERDLDPLRSFNVGEEDETTGQDWRCSERLKLQYARLEEDFFKTGIVIIDEEATLDDYRACFRPGYRAGKTWKRDIEPRLLADNAALLKKAANMPEGGQLIGVYSDGTLAIRQRSQEIVTGRGTKYSLPNEDDIGELRLLFYPEAIDEWGQFATLRQILNAIKAEGYHAPTSKGGSIKTGLVAASEVVTGVDYVKGEPFRVAALENNVNALSDDKEQVPVVRYDRDFAPSNRTPIDKCWADHSGPRCGVILWLRG